ncbi:flagellar protein FlaG [Methylobacterium sp. NEAU 140]|uniref:flagellar protein FlaG n=1 Tax=Methylobacterium sp. NEAU 140 TaxID=3064945 RepID=UPI002735982B|nr:flagellar protein FlaG [Methylobacterium sp. NEAU 140]MDP4021863.1 flagellar protein FlaG [Methylobacterium sp. NEAU 140]
MEIRSLAAGPQGLDAIGATAAPPARTSEPPTSNALDPPVKVEIGADARAGRFTRDADTSTMVFQVVDSASGDVVEQLPSETALRNRAYDSARAQRSESAGLSRVA